MPNPIAYFELAGPDGPKLQRFHAGVFGWAVDSARTRDYARIDTGSGVPGGIRQDPADTVVYVRVGDLPATLKQVTALGGTVLVAPTEVPRVVTFALFKDPAGNVTGIIL